MANATVVLGTAGSGVFFGLLAYWLVTAATNVRSWLVVVACIMLATALSAAIVWNVLGYGDIVS